MAYENLKSAIKQAIKQNGNQEITGNLLQSTFLNVVNTIGADYKFLGFATPSTVPPTSEEGNLFYFAITPGNYSNFRTSTGNLVISIENGIFFFTKNATESYWNSSKIFEIVQTTGEAEDKVMSQKATTTAIADETTRAKAAEKAIIFDVSAYNSGTAFESLSTLLSNSNLSTLIPTSVRHGGMSIRFIQSSDNKYVQYRLMSDTFNTTPTNWQGVDEEPVVGSDNLVKSGGVYNSTPTVANSYTESDLDISDEDGNVLAIIANGHIKVKNFDSADINESISAILSNMGFDNITEFSEEENYVIGEIVRYGKLVYVFTSAHEAGKWNESEVKETVITTEHPIEVSDGVSEADLDIVDEQGNILARFSNGGFQVKDFNSTQHNDLGGLMFLSNVSACKYSGNLMHISFDDTSLCLKSLFSKSHESIYDVAFFSNLKTLHDTYGACFSCYIYVESLANVNNTYATEFQAAKDWLKWNFHTLNDKKYTDNTPINSDYTLGISRLLTMVGDDKECLDHQMRGNYWKLSLANAKYVRDNTAHSSYIFCANTPFATSSDNYYLNDKQKAFISNNSFLIDIENRVLFIKTCALLDTEEKTTASKKYIANNLKCQKSCEVLNHEWAFDFNRMSTFLGWAKNTMNFRFGFFDNIYKF